MTIFIFLNSLGKFESRLVIDMPADYGVIKRISFGNFTKQSMPQLKKFLVAEGIEERRVVFNTGDAALYSLPFIYVDVDFPIAVFVRYPATVSELRLRLFETDINKSVELTEPFPSRWSDHLVEVVADYLL